MQIRANVRTVKSGLAVVTMVVTMLGQVVKGADFSSARIETNLKALLRWELLWSNSRIALAVPPRGSAHIGLHIGPSGLAYCSLDLAKCAEYRLDDGRLGQRLKSVPCVRSAAPCSYGDDLRAATAFAGTTGAKVGSQDTEKLIFGGTIAGRPVEPAEVGWEAELQIGDRRDIIESYRKLRPAGLDGLLRWLQERYRGSIYKSITVPCYAASDPEVYAYGERSGEGSIIVGVSWNEELEAWQVVEYLDRAENAAQITRMGDLIRSMSCGTIKFEGGL